LSRFLDLSKALDSVLQTDRKFSSDLLCTAFDVFSKVLHLGT